VDPKTNAQENWKKRFIISKNGTIEPVTERFLVTDGTSLQKVLSMKDVDYRRTYTNDIIEIFKVLGIEGVRKAIEREITHVISYDGSYVNYRHLALLCDVMTTKGHLMAITRHGINRQDLSPIMKSTFEETVDVLIEAAAHSEYDLLKGVSENILLGQLAKIGTGAFEVLLNVEKCASAMELPMTNVDAFQGLMSKTAIEQYNKRPLNASTPWIESMPITPSHESYYLSTPAQITPMRSERFSPTYSLDYSLTSPDYMPLSPYTNLASYNLQSPRTTDFRSPSYSLNSPSYASTSPHYDSSTSNHYGSKSIYYRYLFLFIYSHHFN
jgi:DNA-directed RNA polymerase II subunit RPB1